MLLLLAGLAGLLVGLAVPGSAPSALARLRFRAAWIVVAAFAFKEAGILTPLGDTSLAGPLYALSVAVLVAWTFWHRDQLSGLVVVAAGLSLNLLVAVANGGYVPVAPAAAAHGPQVLIAMGHFGQYVLAGRGTRLDILGDWIALPGGLGRLLPYAYSPGDLIAAAGMLVSGFQAGRPRASARS